MKYLMISPGLCVQPEMGKPVRNKPVDRCSYKENHAFFNETFRYHEHIKSLPKLPTTCTLSEGEWFEGREQKQCFALNRYGGRDWVEYPENIYNTTADAYRRKVIVPVEQKDVEAVCQKCGGHNPVWSAENNLFNEVNGSPYGIMCPICFDKMAIAKGVTPYYRATKEIPVNGQSLKQSDAVEFAEWVKKHCSWVARNGNWGWATDLAEFPGLYTIPELYKLFTLK